MKKWRSYIETRHGIFFNFERVKNILESNGYTRSNVKVMIKLNGIVQN